MKRPYQHGGFLVAFGLVIGILSYLDHANTLGLVIGAFAIVMGGASLVSDFFNQTLKILIVIAVITFIITAIGSGI